MGGPEVGRVDFVGWEGIEQNKHQCLLTNKWRLGLLLHTKIMEPTLLGECPWLLCWAHESTIEYSDCK